MHPSRPDIVFGAHIEATDQCVLGDIHATYPKPAHQDDQQYPYAFMHHDAHVGRHGDPWQRGEDADGKKNPARRTIQMSIDVERNADSLRDRIPAMATDQRKRNPVHQVAEQDGAADQKDRKDPVMMNASCMHTRLPRRARRPRREICR